MKISRAQPILFVEPEIKESFFECIGKIIIDYLTGYCHKIINVILSIYCGAFFIFTTYEPNIVLRYEKIFFWLNFSCRCYFIINAIIDIVIGNIELSFKNTYTFIIEFISTIPYMLARTTVGMKEDLISPEHLITSSFVCFRCFKTLEIAKYIKTDITRNIYTIMCSIFSLLINGAILVNIIENIMSIGKYFLFLPRDCTDIYFCHGQNETFHSSFYFIMTTISIVGYSSNITSVIGRIITCIIIILSIIEIPSQCSDLMILLSSKSSYARATYNKLEGADYILITGNISSSSLGVLLQEYFHPDHGSNERHAIILLPQRPDCNIKVLLQEYPNKLFYLEGDPMKYHDLERCQFKDAKMIMILCNKQNDDSAAEDSKTIIQSMAIKKYLLQNKENTEKTTKRNIFNNSPTFFFKNPNLKEETKENSKIVVQLIKPESELHLTLSGGEGAISFEQIVCIDELKLALLAKSCLCPGLITLISNLIITSNFDAAVQKELGDPRWMEEYKGGKEYEIYKISLDPMRGNKFVDCAKKIYEAKKTILFGINIESTADKSNVVLLSPMDFVLPLRKDIAVYGYLLAKDKNDADNIAEWAVKTQKKDTIQEDIPEEGNNEDEHSQQNSLINNNKRVVDFSNEEEEEDEDLSGNQKDNYLNNPIIEESSTTKDIIGLLKVCHSSPEPIPRNIMIKERIEPDGPIKDHIIICGMSSNLKEFLKPLRALSLPLSRLLSVVILTPELPDDRALSPISRFKNVFFVQGEAGHRSDLIRAGLRTAKTVVLLASGRVENRGNGARTSREEEDRMDAVTIFKYNLISKLNKDVFIVVELINPKNVSFLNNRNRKNNEEYAYIKAGLGIDGTASFAAGEVYFSSIMDNLITQAYYNPSLLSVLRKLILGEEVSNSLDKHNIINQLPEFKSGNLYLIDLPQFLLKKCSETELNDGIKFEKIFMNLLEKNVVVIGIYRAGDLKEKMQSRDDESDKSSDKNSNSSKYNSSSKMKKAFDIDDDTKPFYFVVTAPDADYMVGKKDKLFVISLSYPDPSVLGLSSQPLSHKASVVHAFPSTTQILPHRDFDDEARNVIAAFNRELALIRSLVEELRRLSDETRIKAADTVQEGIKRKIEELMRKNDEEE